MNTIAKRGLILLAVSAAVSVSRGSSAQTPCAYDANTKEAINRVAQQVAKDFEAAPAAQSRAQAASAAVDNQMEPALEELLVRALAGRGASQAVVESREDAGAIGEVLRHDKQVAAPPGSSGTTTLAERAALPLLLGLAIERGAIQQKQDGSSLTLSTSPYALLALGNEDNSDLYKNNKLARMFGVSANFQLEDASAGLNGLKASDFSSVTAKVTFGDRSTRSHDFETAWQKVAARIFQNKYDKLAAVLSSCATTVESPIYRREAELRKSGTLRNDLIAYLQDNATATHQDRVTAIATRIENELCSEITAHAEELSTSCNVAQVSRELNEIAQLDRQGQAEVAKLVETFQRDQVLYSATYSLNRVDAGSDYSEVKLIGDGLLPYLSMPVQPIVNAYLSINHDPDDKLDQRRVRDFGATLSLATTIASPLSGTLMARDPFSKVGVSLSAAYRRLNDIEKHAAIVQANFDIPMAAGFSLPLALSYASRTETNGKDQFTVSVGGAFDTERLMALARLGVL